MAEAVIGGLFLSGFINAVFDRLLSPEVANLIRSKKLHQETLERLKTALCAAQALLIDAAQKQTRNPNAVYLADDLLDQVSTKAATQKGVTNFLPRFLNFQDREIVNKMEEVVRRIEDIEKRKYILGLEEIGRESLSWRTPSTSLVKGNIYGREDDQDVMIKILNDNIEDKISVIPIVGMGGVGKTTLAQWLYNNEVLTKEFDLKAWVCVSEEFDVIKITKMTIEEKLTGKKFFVVMDDVWSDDYDAWNSLKRPFQYGIKGNHACFPKSNGNSTLEIIGREIVKKCKGSPLAAQTLGGLLRAKHDVKDWNAVLTNEIWEFSLNDSKIIPALRITSRLFFKQYKNDDAQSFVMHNLMHDLATSVAEDFYFRSEELGKEDNIKIHTCHLSYGRLSHPISKSFDAIDELKSLRTFLQVNFSPPTFSFESTASIILSKFKYLRVLSFYYCRELDVLPDSIGEWIHLHYLDLSKTSIQTLPESFSNLFNLQTLKLLECDKLTMLPSGMQNLENLRHLDIRGTSLEEMPQGMSKLKHLQLLSHFVVSKHEENGIKELGELSNLHGSLWIRKLENVTNTGEAMKARIMDKTHIQHLSIEWSWGGDITTSTITEREIFDKLQPHKGLKKLTIKRYGGTRFPDWVGHSFYHNMTHISLKSCSNCCMLPSLGQLPFLKSLEIADFKGVETVGVEFYKNDNDHSSLETPFPSSEHPSFHKMPSWEMWHLLESDAFPQLKWLTIINCPILTGGLPDHLPALETLVIDRCEQLVSSPPCAPTIRESCVSKSNKVRLQELPTSLQYLSIEGCEAVESMFSAITTHPTCLRSLSISNCSSAVSFPGNCLPKCLKKLRIWNCEKLRFPKQQHQPHELLESLSINNICDSLTSFPFEAFPNLKHLVIVKCENLDLFQCHRSPVFTILTSVAAPILCHFP
ncbi:putative disease resistance RPP13 protein 1 [Spatholobus suberectus]|nr:putative disease resistance RPP13 protein 1 [Spatholobus suberectus]